MIIHVFPSVNVSSEAAAAHEVIPAETARVVKRWSSLSILPHVSVVHIHLGKPLWMYCPGPLHEKGNDWADRLAGKSNHHKSLASRKLGSIEELETLFVGTIPRTSHRKSPGGDGVERGSARRSSFKGLKRAIFSQANMETVLRTTLGKHLKDGMERIWAFPNEKMTSWNTTAAASPLPPPPPTTTNTSIMTSEYDYVNRTVQINGLGLSGLGIYWSRERRENR